VYSQVADALKQVARHAAKHNLPVALENHGGLTTTAEQINRILDAVNEPNIGVNYDPANFLMYGEDPYRALQELKHPLLFTHFKSLKKQNGKKIYCRIVEGEIDYVPILKWLTKTYKGFYALEYEETSDVFAGSQDDLDSLKALLKIAHKG
jgi:sugar phosphate isomerase/epimerase